MSVNPQDLPPPGNYEHVGAARSSLWLSYRLYSTDPLDPRGL